VFASTLNEAFFNTPSKLNPFFSNTRIDALFCATTDTNNLLSLLVQNNDSENCFTASVVIPKFQKPLPIQ
jgi:hypothetical protein